MTDKPTPEQLDPAGGAKFPFWVSWWDDPVVSFEIHSPWWFSGMRFNNSGDDDDDGGQSSVCAAIWATSEDDAKRQVVESYDDPVTLEWRFAEERHPQWTPFSDRFQRRDWMHWN